MRSKKFNPPKFPEQRRVVLDRMAEDHLTPAERLAEHKASRVPGPYANTVRLTIRTRGDERPTVRKMYDRTVKPKKGAKS